MQKILSSLRRAVSDFNMIMDGDSIAVGLSGGKDSLTLLAGMANYKLFSPQKFSLSAVTLDMGFENTDFTALTEFSEGLGVEHRIVKTDIYEIVFEIRKEKNPCSLCAKLRRGILNSEIKKLGCNKLALGHHRDDLIETMLLSLVFESRFYSLSPVSYMDRSEITLIRPLIYTPESEIIKYAKDLPVCKNPCPKNHYTQRENMKNLLKNLEQTFPFIKDNIFGAIQNPDRNRLWDKPNPNSKQNS